jgi:hypothetical protein
MSKASIETQLETIRQLRTAGASPDAAARLQPLLRHANNLVVARAADLARELDLRETLPELIAAFPRFLEDAAKKDPQCWAKNALSKALHHLGCTDAQLFLTGLRMHQYEPVWGGQSDVAGTLRSNCAHALNDCPELTHQGLLLHLLEIVNDADKSVRAEGVRAIASAGGDSAILMLRLLAVTTAEKEPEVMGHCYSGLLSLEGTSAIPFVAQFLAKQDDFSAEAAVALGETRTPEALVVLLQSLHPSKVTAKEPDAPRTRPRIGREALLEPYFASVLLSAIALTRQPEAIDTLLTLVADESSYAEAAIEALANANFGDDVKEKLAATVTRLQSTRISQTHKRHFST